MKRELLRIEPVSATRVGFFVGLAAGVVFWILELLLMKLLSGAGGEAMLPPGGKDLLGLGAVGVMGMAVISSLLFSLLFAVFGGLLAVFYNLAARFFGGFEICVSDAEAEPAPPTHTTDNPDDNSYD
ncbi:MAG: DUF3566 domain-containing protein [bacterium]|nr:DUF3566 domain-containing protein [bacterium]